MLLQILEAVGAGQNHHCDSDGGEILRKLETSVSGQQNVESTIDCSAKKDAVPEPQPAFGMDGGDVVIA